MLFCHCAVGRSPGLRERVRDVVEGVVAFHVHVHVHVRLSVLDAEAAVRDLSGVDSVAVDVVYAPPWTYDRITDRGREQLVDHGVAVPGDPWRSAPNCRE